LGNAQQTIAYTANGEASDWITGKLGILSFSPELGSTDPKSDNFFTPKNTFWAILEENYPPLVYLMRILSPNLLIDYTREYRFSDPITETLHASILEKSANAQSTFGIQIQNNALTEAEYSINFNITYSGILNQSQVPTILVTSYEYDLDYYTQFSAHHPTNSSSSSNLSTDYRTTGVSKHIDVLSIPGATQTIPMLRAEIIDQKNDRTIISYHSLNSKKAKRMIYQKFYFTLSNNTPFYADKCELSLQITQQNQHSVVLFERSVFSDVIKPYQPEPTPNDIDTSALLLNYLFYLVSTILLVLAFLLGYRWLRRRSEQRYVSENSEGSDNEKNPHVQFQGESEYQI
jgi:hypothetical protein